MIDKPDTVVSPSVSALDGLVSFVDSSFRAIAVCLVHLVRASIMATASFHMQKELDVGVHNDNMHIFEHKLSRSTDSEQCNRKGIQALAVSHEMMVNEFGRGDRTSKQETPSHP